MGLRLIYLINIPGSSLGVLSDTIPHDVRKIPWTSQDPPLVSPQRQSPMLSGGFLAQPGILPWCPLGYPGILLWCPLRHRPPCCLEDPLEIPESSLGVPSDTGPLLSGGSLGHPRILPSCPLQTQDPKLSGGSQDPSPPFTSVQGKWTTCTCAISLCGCEGVRLPL